MIISFFDKTTTDLYNGVNSKQARKLPIETHKRARRILDQLNASAQIEDLRVPPSNRLEKLDGKNDSWSLRVNNQFRVEFVWKAGHAYEVRVWDYH